MQPKTFIFINKHTGEEMPITALTETIARLQIRARGYNDTNWELQGAQG